MGVRSYRELLVWTKAIAFVTDIYSSTRGFPREEMYGLVSQIRRAAISIPSNIAKGQGRLTRGEFRQFLGHARGSVFELDSQILISRNLGYLCEGEANRLSAALDELGRMINGLLKAVEYPQADRATNH